MEYIIGAISTHFPKLSLYEKYIAANPPILLPMEETFFALIFASISCSTILFGSAKSNLETSASINFGFNSSLYIFEIFSDAICSFIFSC